MGYVGCQPDDHPESIAAMIRENEGGPCEFLTNAKDVGAPPRLRPITMGSQRNRGYETRLHSHLGEAFSLRYGIDSNRLYCWGVRFTAMRAPQRVLYVCLIAAKIAVRRHTGFVTRVFSHFCAVFGQSLCLCVPLFVPLMGHLWLITH
jgi:hypothetical protein